MDDLRDTYLQVYVDMTIDDDDTRIIICTILSTFFFLLEVPRLRPCIHKIISKEVYAAQKPAVLRNCEGFVLYDQGLDNRIWRLTSGKDAEVNNGSH